MTPYLWSQARGWFTEQKHAQLQAAAVSSLKPGFPMPPSSAPVFPTQPAKVGRNEPCLCGSGKKFKHCCG